MHSVIRMNANDWAGRMETGGPEATAKKCGELRPRLEAPADLTSVLQTCSSPQSLSSFDLLLNQSMDLSVELCALVFPIRYGNHQRVRLFVQHIRMAPLAILTDHYYIPFFIWLALLKGPARGLNGTAAACLSRDVTIGGRVVVSRLGFGFLQLVEVLLNVIQRSALNQAIADLSS